MAERPLLFSAPMVRALLAGQKTQTRRIVKPQPVSVGYKPLLSFNRGLPEISFGPDDTDARGLRWWRCPYGLGGDRLWVKETYRFPEQFDGNRPTSVKENVKIHFEADGPPRTTGSLYGKLRPSIHMPRVGSRLLLAITEVRLERLQKISEADALAEGITYQREAIGLPGHDGVAVYRWEGGHEAGYTSAVAAYRGLWEEINGPGSWAANPWVWALSFERVQR